MNDSPKKSWVDDFITKFKMGTQTETLKETEDNIKACPDESKTNEKEFSENFICHFDACKLYLEEPITLPCGIQRNIKFILKIFL